MSKTVLFDLVFLTPRQKVSFGPRTQNDDFLGTRPRAAPLMGRDLVSHPLDQWAYYPAVRAELRQRGISPSKNQGKNEDFSPYSSWDYLGCPTFLNTT